MNKGAILAVDDDEDLQVVLGQYLESEGYTVATAKTGAEMQTHLDATKFDLILLDLMLPDADGITLIRQIRAQTQVPVVVVSGKSDTMEKVVCLEMGADDYMTKPFEVRELSARIKVALRRNVVTEVQEKPSKDKKTIIEFGQYVLDRDQFQLFNDAGESLDITTGEFQLLETLAMAPNRALNREQLFERTRDGEYDSYDRAIDIQIGRIRKRLGDEGNDIIKTVRGIGYMFCPPKK